MKPELFNELRKLRNELLHREPPLSDQEVTRRLKELGLKVSPSESSLLIPALISAFDFRNGLYFAPQVVLQSITSILNGHTASIVCDPWAGLGSVIQTVQNVTQPKKAIALTEDESNALLGKILAPEVEWLVGKPLQLLEQTPKNIDVLASILPMGFRYKDPIIINTTTGNEIELRDDFGNILLAMTAQRLKADGMGLFIISASFFFTQRSVFHHFSELGLGIEAAFALPAGSFAPYAGVKTYLVIVRKQIASQMFVAQLTNDLTTNLQIIKNFKQGTEGGNFELGRFVEPHSFKGFEALRAEEMARDEQQRFGVPAIILEDLASEVHLGRYGKQFEFPKRENVVFIPLIGISDVVDSIEALTLKPQNYAQVVVDPAKSDARFVARFLNSEYGKKIRQASKTSGVIPKLNKKSLVQLRLFVPELATQTAILEIEARIVAEQNTVLGLQNELAELRQQLWDHPTTSQIVEQRLRAYSSRLSGSVKQHNNENLEEWFETLPFPLASILRAYQITPINDYKTRYERLLHFFEATAEFLSVILLSAFNSRPSVFAPHREKIKEKLQEQHLSFQRASFGTWKFVVEYLGKQTRNLVKGNPDAQALCADIFADPSLELPKLISNAGITSVLSATNKMRNDWPGHGGIVGQTKAQLRHEQTLSELHKLRQVMATGWTGIELIRGVNSRLRRGLYENDVNVLMGSNHNFLPNTYQMSMCLDVEHLFILKRGVSQSLQLLPFVRMEQVSGAASDACFFFNRKEDDGLKFVSYHFAPEPEIKRSYENEGEIMDFLKEV